jgi:hypothetical protein
LSAKDGEPNSTEASYWRIILSPAGPGHVLYLKSELTEGRWRIYSDNIAMARWLQSTVQGMLNAELSDTTIPCADAQCTVLIPALGTRLVRNGVEAEGRSWPREREGRPFSTSA